MSFKGSLAAKIKIDEQRTGYAIECGAPLEYWQATVFEDGYAETLA